MLGTFKDNDLAINTIICIIFFYIFLHMFLFLLTLLVCLGGTGNAGRMC